ncbi:LptF/LptG family permease [Sulfurimonas lithotrophica]|uniref:LptF/LptG family permease n=1 Tax=Sulfurimonas lithotrophica TaxID=2590022 RepID=A0A5P8P0G4_9BACT|nr:LptF/LptG family permease [Sulfurimonas lithotrophica]QFR49202.1 LptF/LptG family permease [Sulfurimonas lithotrophica]
MKILQKYIINNLSVLFLSVFLPLFSIASVIFLIKLATYTAVVQLSIWEMTKMYIFVLPDVFFFTLPFSFFIAATLTLFKLSNDNEIIVLFSLGIHPNFIIKTLLKPAALLAVLLFLNFFVLYPHAKTLSKNFIAYKKSQAKFNLSASEFGHKFGPWLLYIGKDNPDDTFEDVFLFKKNKQDNEEVLISAKKAKIINETSLLRLKLTNGEGYSYSKDKFSQINFDTMYINSSLTTDLVKYETPLEYWQSDFDIGRKYKTFITDTLMSLFPMMSLFLAASIGIVHVRHNKGKAYLYMFLGIIVFYESIQLLWVPLFFYAIPTIAIVWLIGTYMIYRKTIVAKF